MMRKIFDDFFYNDIFKYIEYNYFIEYGYNINRIYIYF